MAKTFPEIEFENRLGEDYVKVRARHHRPGSLNERYKLVKKDPPFLKQRLVRAAKKLRAELAQRTRENDRITKAMEGAAAVVKLTPEEEAWNAINGEPERLSEPSGHSATFASLVQQRVLDETRPANVGFTFPYYNTTQKNTDPTEPAESV